MSLRRRRPAQWLALESSKAISETISISITRTAGAPTAAWRVVDGGQIYEYAGDALSHVVVVGPCKIECRIAPKWISALDFSAPCSLIKIKNLRKCENLASFISHWDTELALDTYDFPPTFSGVLFLVSKYFTGNLAEFGDNFSVFYIFGDSPSKAITGLVGDIIDIPTNATNVILEFCPNLTGTDIHHLIDIHSISFANSSILQARVDAIILDIWQHRADFTYAGGITCNLDGNNAAPSGNVTAPEEGSDWHLDGEIWIPLTPGAMVFDLVNDVNSEGFNFWNITVT